MNTSENINELATALAAAQGELEDAGRDKKGYGYSYADLAQVLQLARPVLSKHGLSVIQMPHNEDGGIALTTRLCHSSGQWIEDTLVLPAEQGKGMSVAQSIGSVITYGRRYTLTAMVGITQEDNDAAMKDAKPIPMPTKTYEKEAQALRTAAEGGIESMQAVWTKLTAPQKQALNDLKEELKPIATSAGGDLGAA